MISEHSCKTLFILFKSYYFLEIRKIYYKNKRTYLYFTEEPMIRLKRKVWRLVLICSVSVILWRGRRWISSTSESELQLHVNDHQRNVAVQKGGNVIN